MLQQLSPEEKDIKNKIKPGAQVTIKDSGAPKILNDLASPINSDTGTKATNELESAELQKSNLDDIADSIKEIDKAGS